MQVSPVAPLPCRLSSASLTPLSLLSPVASPLQVSLLCRSSPLRWRPDRKLVVPPHASAAAKRKASSLISTHGFLQPGGRPSSPGGPTAKSPQPGGRPSSPGPRLSLKVSSTYRPTSSPIPVRRPSSVSTTPPPSRRPSTVSTVTPPSSRRPSSVSTPPSSSHAAALMAKREEFLRRQEDLLKKKQANIDQQVRAWWLLLHSMQRNHDMQSVSTFAAGTVMMYALYNLYSGFYDDPIGVSVGFFIAVLIHYVCCLFIFIVSECPEGG